MGKVWKWLNGKKTAIGTTLILVGKGMQLNSELKPVGELVEWTGSALAGFGLMHKVGKIRINPTK